MQNTYYQFNVKFSIFLIGKFDKWHFHITMINPLLLSETKQEKNTFIHQIDIRTIGLDCTFYYFFIHAWAEWVC